MIRFLMICALVLLNGCSSKTTFGPGSNPSASDVPTPTGLDVVEASPVECARGGKTYLVYLDLDRNSRRDESDQIISRQAVCNGENGFSTLFAMDRVQIGVTTCASGSGLEFHSGLDRDFSGELEPSEYLHSQLLCDGSAGVQGQTGPAGRDGASFQIATLPAPASTCASGGSTLLMALDVDHTGHYNSSDPEQQSLTICNGLAAAPTAYTPVDTIQPCGNTVPYKEVLLLLQNGELIASFSENAQGDMTRLTFLSDGTYMDTDSSQCTFTLSTSADQSTRSISWGGSVQRSWPKLAD